MRWVIIGSIFVLFGVPGFAGCTGRPLVQGLPEPGGAIYQDAEQEDYGTRATAKVRSFEF